MYPREVTPLGQYIVETIVTLLAIVALGVLVIVAARRAGVGKSGGPLTLVGRLPLDSRRTVYLVRVAGTVYVVGASEAGLFKLGELPDDGFASEFELSAPRSFRETFERVLQRPKKASSESPSEPPNAEPPDAEPPPGAASRAPKA